jgi:16S rRNA processing protein RimM
LTSGSDVQLVELGVVTRPQGVRGEVRVHPFNPDSDLLGTLEEVFLVSEDGATRHARVLRVTRAPKIFVIAFEGVTTRDGAEGLRGLTLAVPRETLPETDDDEYYLVDLPGLDVVQGETRIGAVLRVLEYPSMECIEVEFEDGLREIPLLPPWVEEVDLDAGVVRIGDCSDVPLSKART